MRTSATCLLKEVEEPEDHDPGLRRLRRAGEIKEVARIDCDLVKEPAAKRTVPDS